MSDSKVKTITIDEKKYDIDSLTQKGTMIISNLQRIDKETEDLQFKISAYQLAKGKLLEELGKEVPNFKEVKELAE